MYEKLCPNLSLERHIEFPDEYEEQHPQVMWEGYLAMAQSVKKLKVGDGFIGEAAEFSGSTGVVAVSALRAWVSRNLPGVEVVER